MIFNSSLTRFISSPLLIFFSFVHLCKLLLLACNFNIIFDLVFLNVGLLDLTSFCDVCVVKKM